MWAFCVPWSFSTATCAPTETKPPVPVKAIALTVSSIPAWTVTLSPPPLPAVICVPAPTFASVALLTLRISMAAPMPTSPPATAPARAVTERLSPAMTLTLWPAWIVPLSCAEVPAGTVVCRALLATVVPGAFAAMAALLPPVLSEIRPLVEYSPSSKNHSPVFVAGSIVVLTMSRFAL